MLALATKADSKYQPGDTVLVQLDAEAYAECVVVEPITDHSYIVECEETGERFTFVAL